MLEVLLRKSEANEPFSFVFVDDGKTIIKSENYAQKSSAKNGIESVKKNCLEDARYELKEASNGKFFFNIKSTNGQIVGTSGMFDSAADRSSTIANLKKQAPTAVVTDKA